MQTSTEVRQQFIQGCNILRWWFEAGMLATHSDFWQARAALDDWYGTTLEIIDRRYRESEQNNAI